MSSRHNPSQREPKHLPSRRQREPLRDDEIPPRQARRQKRQPAETEHFNRKH